MYYAVFPSFWTRKLLYQVASHRTGVLDLCCEMLGQSSLKFSSILRFYTGCRKGTRATFSLFSEQPLPCNPGPKPALTAYFPGPGEGELLGDSTDERTASGNIGAEGSWLWLEPSDFYHRLKTGTNRAWCPRFFDTMSSRATSCFWKIWNWSQMLLLSRGSQLSSPSLR